MATAEQDPVHWSEEWLRERYWGEHMSMPEMAEEAGVSTETIRRWMERHGVDTRSRRMAAGRPRVPRDELVEDLRRVDSVVDGRPSTTDQMEHGEYSPTPFLRVWGSWLDAVYAALDEAGGASGG